MEIPEWISIFYERPDHGQIVITYHEDTGVDIMKCYHVDDKWGGETMFTSCLGFLTDDVTHWIPLGKTVQNRMGEVGYV